MRSKTANQRAEIVVLLILLETSIMLEACLLDKRFVTNHLSYKWSLWYQIDVRLNYSQW